MFNTSIRVREFNAREKNAYQAQSNETDNNQTTITLKPCVKMIRNFESEEESQTQQNRSSAPSRPPFDDRDCIIHFTASCEKNRIDCFPSSDLKKRTPGYGTTGINNLFWSVPISQGFSAMKFANQQSIFEAIGLPAVNRLMQQHKNSTFVAHGIRGSGKSFTLLDAHPQFRSSSTSSGANSSKSPISASVPLDDLKEAGLFVRCLYEIFRRLLLLAETSEQQENSTSVEFSAYELDNEKVHDLLSTSPGVDEARGGDHSTKRQSSEFRTPRFVTNELTGEVGIEGVKRIKIHSCSEAIVNFELGLQERSFRETRMSMLHKCTTVVEINLVVVSSSSRAKTTRRSQLRFIEFMGHDREKKTSFFPGMNVDSIKNQSLGLNSAKKCIDTMLENQEIMESFLRLSTATIGHDDGDDVNNLEDRSLPRIRLPRTKIPYLEKNDDNSHINNAIVKIGAKQILPIPYRESKITTIMKDVFLGKCKTYFVGVISPSDSNYEESVCTCKFVDRWRRVNLFFDFASHEIVNCLSCDDDGDGDDDWLQPNPEYDSDIFERANTKWLKELFQLEC